MLGASELEITRVQGSHLPAQVGFLAVVVQYIVCSGKAAALWAIAPP